MGRCVSYFDCNSLYRRISSIKLKVLDLELDSYRALADRVIDVGRELDHRLGPDVVRDAPGVTERRRWRITLSRTHLGALFVAACVFGIREGFLC